MAVKVTMISSSISSAGELTSSLKVMFAHVDNCGKTGV